MNRRLSKVMLLLAGLALLLWGADQLQRWGCDQRPNLGTPPFVGVQAMCVWIGPGLTDINMSFRTDTPPEQVLAFYRAEIQQRGGGEVKQDDGRQLLGIWRQGAVPKVLLDNPYVESAVYSKAITQSFSFSVQKVSTRRRWLVFGQTVVTIHSRWIDVRVDPSP